MFQDISIEELLELQHKKELVLIDVRSPSEYSDATIPGSLNIPLFNDTERAEIGTLYKQVSVQAAKEKGLEIVSAKLPAFIKTFRTDSGSKDGFLLARRHAQQDDSNGSVADGYSGVQIIRRHSGLSEVGGRYP